MNYVTNCIKDEVPTITLNHSKDEQTSPVKLSCTTIIKALITEEQLRKQY